MYYGMVKPMPIMLGKTPGESLLRQDTPTYIMAKGETIPWHERPRWQIPYFIILKKPQKTHKIVIITSV
jgi:hypothetical protein